MKDSKRYVHFHTKEKTYIFPITTCRASCSVDCGDFHLNLFYQSSCHNDYLFECWCPYVHFFQTTEDVVLEYKSFSSFVKALVKDGVVYPVAFIKNGMEVSAFED